MSDTTEAVLRREIRELRQNAARAEESALRAVRDVLDQLERAQGVRQRANELERDLELLTTAKRAEQ